MRSREILKALKLLEEFVMENKDAIDKYEKNKEKEENSDLEDLFSLYIKGEETLRKYLMNLDTKTLKNIIKEYGLDRTRKSARWRKKERLIEFIVKKLREYHKKGSVFLGE